MLQNLLFHSINWVTKMQLLFLQPLRYCSGCCCCYCCDLCEQKTPEAGPFQGLAVKRQLKKIQEEMVPRAAKQVKEYFGKDVIFEVDYDSFVYVQYHLIIL